MEVPEDPVSPPVPVELMFGNSYTSINFVLSKPMAPASRWGVFHQSTLVAGYDSDEVDDLATQSLLTFAPGGRFRLTAGAFYASFPGVSPAIGMQYLLPGERWFVLVSPRVNLERDQTYSVFSILRYERSAGPGKGLYMSMQAHVRCASAHQSYQWMRAGLQLRGTQFGLGVNFDEDGPRPRVETSAGLFVRRELF